MTKSLSQVNILIGSMTSTCLEAMGLGIPVVVLEQPYGLFGLLTIPNEIPQNYWKYCNNPKNINDAITYFKTQQKDFTEMKNYILQNYFEKVTKKNVSDFLRPE